MGTGLQFRSRGQRLFIGSVPEPAHRATAEWHDRQRGKFELMRHVTSTAGAIEAVVAMFGLAQSW
jgi:hypothetical protein